MSRSIVFKVLGLVAAVAAVAVFSCLLAFYAFIRPQMGGAHHPETFVEHLDLDAGLRERVEEIDRGFEQDRQRLLAEFREATRELEALLQSEDAFSDEVAEAIRGIHHIHGDLQALSIHRYFSVLEVLPPDQQAVLRRLASEALSEPH